MLPREGLGLGMGGGRRLLPYVINFIVQFLTLYQIIFLTMEFFVEKYVSNRINSWDVGESPGAIAGM